MHRASSPRQPCGQSPLSACTVALRKRNRQSSPRFGTTTTTTTCKVLGAHKPLNLHSILLGDRISAAHNDPSVGTSSGKQPYSTQCCRVRTRSLDSARQRPPAPRPQKLRELELIHQPSRTERSTKPSRQPRRWSSIRRNQLASLSHGHLLFFRASLRRRVARNSALWWSSSQAFCFRSRVRASNRLRRGPSLRVVGSHSHGDTHTKVKLTYPAAAESRRSLLLCVRTSGCERRGLDRRSM